MDDKESFYVRERYIYSSSKDLCEKKRSCLVIGPLMNALGFFYTNNSQNIKKDDFHNDKPNVPRLMS